MVKNIQPPYRFVLGTVPDSSGYQLLRNEGEVLGFRKVESNSKIPKEKGNVFPK